MARRYWKKEIWHNGLNKYKLIKGESKREVELKARYQMLEWDELYSKKIEAEKRAQQKVIEAERRLEEKREEAERKEKEKIEHELFLENQFKKAKELTNSYNIKLDNIRNCLKNSISTPLFSYDDLKDRSEFQSLKPEKSLPYNEDALKEKPDPKNFTPKIFLFDRWIKNRIEKKNRIAEEKYKRAIEEYDTKVKENKIAEKEYKKGLKKWELKKKKFYKKQKKVNSTIDEKKKSYNSKDRKTVIEFMNLVLLKISLPLDYERIFSVDFNEENSILIVEFKLPLLNEMPKVKGIEYNKLKNIFKEILIAEDERKEIYNNLLYQISLAITNIIYKADFSKIIDSIVFNGWIKTIDGRTGSDTVFCIMSLQTNREQFLILTLERINPKECFKGLKGISSLKLYTLTPIAPILQINKDDKRFISSYEVMKDLNESENIAVMDWQDFEHLIREIFEKEFSQNGGEVRVTQSSRDGGVDAVAFDTDPLRGGKIVIQAKRYTNVVGVSAVRDLYGTVVNEGAIKGILVTTANYGADAYEFAKDKPLTLLNGSHLLHLLEKHGRKAKIDLKEAKLLLDKQKRDL